MDSMLETSAVPAYFPLLASFIAAIVQALGLPSFLVNRPVENNKSRNHLALLLRPSYVIVTVAIIICFNCVLQRYYVILNGNNSG